MDNFWSCLKKVLCCSHSGIAAGVPQGPKNPPSVPPKSLTASPSLQDCITHLNEMRDTWNIDVLIQAINLLLKSKLNPISTSTPDTPSGSTELITNTTSVIKSGATFLKFFNEYTEKMDIFILRILKM